MQALSASTKVFVAQAAKPAGAKPRARAAVVVRAQKEEAAVDRRAALGLLAAAAAVSAASPSEAAYGDAARIFAGKITNKSGFVPYAGDGFALLLPSKWNPSSQKEFPGTVLRYEDNFDQVNNLAVIVQNVGKDNIEQLGSPDKFLSDFSYLFGEQVWKGDTKSEGGFAPGKVSTLSVLDVQEATDKKGKKYYKFQVLSRAADGDEGGRHQLVAATVNQGNLYILKVQCGDKRWFKGTKNEVLGALDSFTVA
eukprot:scaffold27.g5998.t1